MTAPSEIHFAHVRGGVEDLARVVPRVPAVYAWFLNFSPPPEPCTAEAFAAFLEREIRRPHMAPRESRLAPLHRVSLRSDRRLSEGKRDDLLKLCGAASFRQEMSILLGEFGTTFAQPLYVGRAGCLRERIEQHLSGTTGLRKRLDEVGIALARCRLVYTDLTNVGLEVGESEATPDVVEELISKLFCPPFTIRYG